MNERTKNRVERQPDKNSPEIQDAIRARARQLYERSGKLPGHDIENWCQAEAEILREYAVRPACSAVVINIEDVLYTGEYDPAESEGYKAGEWKAGDPVPVRFSGDKLYLRRPNGRELIVTIVKRIG